MPLIELMIELLLSLLFFIFAYFLLRHQKINLIHDYHRPWVKPEDNKAYTALYGKAMLVLVGGIALMALVNYITGTAWGWLAFVTGFISAITLILSAQARYNRR